MKQPRISRRIWPLESKPIEALVGENECSNDGLVFLVVLLILLEGMMQ